MIICKFENLNFSTFNVLFKGFVDAGEQMRYAYEDEHFQGELEETWMGLQPLYKELFTYIRRKLIMRYGTEVVRPDGPIPAHILGDVWAQDWSKIADIAMPYTNLKNLDVTDEMLRQGFTPLRMFQMAEEFYTSLGLKPMPPEFWRYSLLEKPNDRRVQCTASAWDFCNKIDFRYVKLYRVVHNKEYKKFLWLFCNNLAITIQRKLYMLIIVTHFIFVLNIFTG